MTWPLAVGHRRATDGTYEVVRPLANDARLWPAGTLYSSANELARFVVALMNDGKVDGKQVLPAGVAAKMRAARATIPSTGQHYGHGLFLTGDLRSGHGGAMTGYTAEFEIEDWSSVPGPPSTRARPIGIVVLTNGDGVNPHAVLEAALVGSPFELIAIGDGGPLPERALGATEAQRYVGTYRNPRRFTVEVVRNGDGLTLRRIGRDFPMRALESIEVRPSSAATDTFIVDLPGGGTEGISFGRGADGRPDYLQMNVWALARITP